MFNHVRPRAIGLNAAAVVDNVFVARLWRSLKYEEVHLKIYAKGHEARIGIGQWWRLYNECWRTSPWVTLSQQGLAQATATNLDS